MSKQTLGDGLFWEKDDYFNLEDEETRGAARSGRNPNAPACLGPRGNGATPHGGFSRKEDTCQLPPRPAEQAVPHKGKLPPF